MPQHAAHDTTPCNLHVFSMHLDGERLWTAVVRAGESRFDRTERSLRQAIRYALTEAERRGILPASPA